MGGHVAGEVASRDRGRGHRSRSSRRPLDADTNRTWPFPFDPAISLEANRLKAAFRLANRSIAAAIDELERSARHGDDGVGASRWRATLPAWRTSATAASTCCATAQLEQLTHDHSWVEEQVRAGTLTPERGAAASLAQRRDPRALRRRRSGSGRRPSSQPQRRALSCSAPTACSRVVPDAADRRHPRRSQPFAPGDLPAADRRRQRRRRARQHHALVLQCRCSITSRSWSATAG